MPKLIVENERGERLQLSQNANYQITRIEGLDPPQANVNIAENANFDGGTEKNSRLNTRNIVLTIVLEYPVEANRIALYKYFRAKKHCMLYYSNGARSVRTDGIVESFECNAWNKKEVAQISILCPNPYLIDTNRQEVNFSVIQPLFEFPFSIPAVGIEFSRMEYDQEETIIAGDVETGMDIKFMAIGSATNPLIYNTETMESMKVDISLEKGDILRINTTRGKRSITFTHEGVMFSLGKKNLRYLSENC